MFSRAAAAQPLTDKSNKRFVRLARCGYLSKYSGGGLTRFDKRGDPLKYYTREEREHKLAAQAVVPPRQ